MGRYTVSVPGSTPRKISVDGTSLTLALQRKRVKNVNARLRGTVLSVSAPAAMPEAKLEPVIRDLARKLLRRAHAVRVNDEEDVLVLARKVAGRFPEPPSTDRVVFVTTQKARWGSYSPRTGTIRLHAALRRMPRWVLEAVVAHELAHAVHPNHSPAFWGLLRRVCPETDRAKAFLDGVSWFAHNQKRLPPVERELLGEIGREGDPRQD